VDLFGDDIKITNRHNFNPVVSNYRPLGGLFWYSCYGDNKLATALLLPESGCLCSNGGVCRVSCVSAIGVADGVFVVGLVSFNLMISVIPASEPESSYIMDPGPACRQAGHAGSCLG
jgi:hypothetical protein